jgi:hypothetical protein
MTFLDADLFTGIDLNSLVGRTDAIVGAAIVPHRESLLTASPYFASVLMPAHERADLKECVDFPAGQYACDHLVRLTPDHTLAMEPSRGLAAILYRAEYA